MMVEVVYALPHEQTLLTVDVPNDCTVLDAVYESGILDQYPDIDRDNLALGIFGQAVRAPEKTTLNPGDRVEIYRPLIADPKEIRKRKAAEEKAKKDKMKEKETAKE